MTATRTWLQALTAWPVPAGPRWTTREPSTEKTPSGALRSAALAADHDRERPVPGADVAAADRRVEEGRPARGGGLGELAAERRGDGAHVDDQGLRRRRGDDAVVAVEHGAQGRVVGQDRHQDVGSRASEATPRQPARRASTSRRAAGAAVPGDDLEAAATGSPPSAPPSRPAR